MNTALRQEACRSLPACCLPFARLPASLSKTNTAEGGTVHCPAGKKQFKPHAVQNFNIFLSDASQAQAETFSNEGDRGSQL
jgi:hypothetical protein